MNFGTRQIVKDFQRLLRINVLNLWRRQFSVGLTADPDTPARIPAGKLNEIIYLKQYWTMPHRSHAASSKSFAMLKQKFPLSKVH